MRLCSPGIPWEKFIIRFTKCSNILDASEDEALTPKQKVDKLFKKIQSTDQKLLSHAEVVQDKYPCDFAPKWVQGYQYYTKQSRQSRTVCSSNFSLNRG